MIRTGSRLALGVVSPALLLAACGGAEADAGALPEMDDAVLATALADQIMVDPDLVGQSQANAAISVGPASGALPPEILSPEAAQRARAEALMLVGGPGMMKKAPQAVEVSGNLPPQSVLTAASRAAAAPGGDVNCAERAQYTARWAARLPDAFPVYPHGAVQEAAGTDEGTCALRVVNFVTSVSLADVMDFYFTRATAAGFSAQRVKEGGDDVLGGMKGRASFIVYARPFVGGGTEVDLVVNGS